eukprot:gnl/Hemi2/6342_TR2169_c0_g1_i1.p1 gnl/Hemi2/6342_TR2169_c0_g1~~gnl/Hemi2/6342_TR2169_c0_g1_i1.p1  ORF type:complete len:295 (+),score=78.45 gnl/Hemi2/6342_TR2169_c0_g1_i1:80-964(+)
MLRLLGVLLGLCVLQLSAGQPVEQYPEPSFLRGFYGASDVFSSGYCLADGRDGLEQREDVPYMTNNRCDWARIDIEGSDAGPKVRLDGAPTAVADLGTLEEIAQNFHLDASPAAIFLSIRFDAPSNEFWVRTAPPHSWVLMHNVSQRLAATQRDRGFDPTPRHVYLVRITQADSILPSPLNISNLLLKLLVLEPDTADKSFPLFLRWNVMFSAASTHPLDSKPATSATGWVSFSFSLAAIGFTVLALELLVRTRSPDTSALDPPADEAPDLEADRLDPWKRMSARHFAPLATNH